MKQRILISLYCLFCLCIQAQQEFHVFPNGKTNGDGSLQNPWDLQTALRQNPDVINGGDTIWLHEGIYNGRFLSTIKSTKHNKFITVAPFNNKKVILNGNVVSDRNGVLNVRGKQVIFKDFEITWMGNFSRNASDEDFQVCAGISHTDGPNCRFYNLIIHNNPGLGIGSWKSTGGTIIENCMIYFNGFNFKTGKGTGEGMYVQNKSDETRLIKNNIIFANYYKGIEVWSAGRDADFEYVKNINLEGNIVFNSGQPSGHSYDNVIVATDDRNGINMAKDIQVIDNVLYHNTDYVKNEVNGDAPSLTIGYVDNTPAENITVKNNIILGRNNALRLLHIKSMTLKDNIIYGGYLMLSEDAMKYTPNWNFNTNNYFTKKASAFRIGGQNYPLSHWQSTYKLDTNSQWNHIREFDLKPVLKIARHSQKTNTFNVVLFNKQGNDVEVDFSDYTISKGSSFNIYDVENRTEILASGIINDDKKVVFPMHSMKFELPMHNNKNQKTLSNFGVFIIEFEENKTAANEKLNSLQKFLKWLGFL